MSAAAAVGPGDVYKGSGRFQDGSEKEKYVVLLSFAEDGQVLLALTTSKGAHTYADPKTDSACDVPSRRFFRLSPVDAPVFPIPTWVQFQQTLLTRVVDLQRLTLMGSISPEKTRSILKCAEASRDLEKIKVARIKRTRERMNADDAARRALASAPPTHWQRLKPHFDKSPEKLALVIELLDFKDHSAFESRLKAKCEDAFLKQLEAALQLVELDT